MYESLVLSATGDGLCAESVVKTTPMVTKRTERICVTLYLDRVTWACCALKKIEDKRVMMKKSGGV